MNEIGEMWAEQKKIRSRFKAERQNRAMELLKKHKVPHEVRNNGFHVIITPWSKRKIDYYPTTGKWSTRPPSDIVKGNGIMTLLAWVGPN